VPRNPYPSEEARRRAEIQVSGQSVLAHCLPYSRNQEEYIELVGNEAERQHLEINTASIRGGYIEQLDPLTKKKMTVLRVKSD